MMKNDPHIKTWGIFFYASTKWRFGVIFPSSITSKSQQNYEISMGIYCSQHTQLSRIQVLPWNVWPGSEIPLTPFLLFSSEKNRSLFLYLPQIKQLVYPLPFLYFSSSIQASFPWLIQKYDSLRIVAYIEENPLMFSPFWYQIPRKFLHSTRLLYQQSFLNTRVRNFNSLSLQHIDYFFCYFVIFLFKIWTFINFV